MNRKEIYQHSAWAKKFATEVQQNMIHHAYLLVSPDELMMQATAQYMAETLVTKNSLHVQLDQQKVEHLTHPDVLYFGDNVKNKMITVEDMEQIIGEVMLSSMESSYKVMIIHHFEQANVMAQNKFLKTLEEPPAGVVFILCCHSLQPVLNTIKSRCQKVNLLPCSKEDITSYLIGQFGSKTGLEDVVMSSEGNLSLAVKLYQDNDYQAMKNICLSILTKMGHSSEVIVYSYQLLQYKDRIQECLNMLEQIISDIAKYQHGALDQLQYVVDTKSFANMPFRYSDQAIATIVAKINESKKMIQSNCVLQGVIDELLLSILEVRYLCKS